MIIKTADYDDNVGSLNALAVEPTGIIADLSHAFNRCAIGRITLVDKDGSIMRKYDVDAANDSVHVGPGRVMVQEPAPSPDDDVSNIIFDGRIVKSLSTMGQNTVTLIAEDWMNQLKDDRIIYDMREKIYQNIRESTLYSGFSIPVYKATGKQAVFAKAYDHGTTTYTDETAGAADVSLNSDMTLMQAPAPAVNDAYYFGFTLATYDMFLDLGSSAGNWVGTMAWEYWDGAAWSAITKVDSGHARWTFETTGMQKYEWTDGGDWATCAVDGTTKYWIRARISVYTSLVALALGDHCTAAPYYLYDNDVIITPNIHNGKYVVFPNNMAGPVSSMNGPYEHQNTVGWDTENRGISGNMWDKTNTFYDHQFIETTTAGTYYVTYWFKMPMGISGHLDTLKSGTLKVIYNYNAVNTTAVDGTCSIQYYNTNTSSYVEITKVTNDLGSGNKDIRSFSIPSTALADFVNEDGDILIKFNMVMVNNADTLELKVYYIQMEIEADTTSYSEVLEVKDCGTRFIEVDHDITETDEALWADCPYCVADKAWTHINGLVTGGDPIVTLSTLVEETSSINTKHYEENTRFEILRDVAQGDKAVLWLPLSTKEVQYKKTFAAGGTAMTDASVIKWTSTEWDWNKVINEYHIYGMRIGDTQVVVDTAGLTPDPGVTSKTTYGATKSEIIRNIGLTTVADAESFGEAMVTKEDDVLLLLEAELLGLSTLRLGDRVDITSTLLGLTSADYVITAWSYNSKNYRTHIKLHPSSSVGYIEYKAFGEHLRDTDETAREARRNIYLPAPAGTVFADP